MPTILRYLSMLRIAVLEVYLILSVAESSGVCNNSARAPGKWVRPRFSQGRSTRIRIDSQHEPCPKPVWK